MSPLWEAPASHMTQRAQRRTFFQTTGGKCCQNVGSKPPNWCKISPRINRKLVLACPCGTPLHRPHHGWRRLFFKATHHTSHFFKHSFVETEYEQPWVGSGGVDTVDSRPAPRFVRFPLKLCHSILFFGFCKNVLHSTNVACSFFSWKQFLSTSDLHDPEADWLLNTLLCMFYECDDYGASIWAGCVPLVSEDVSSI